MATISSKTNLLKLAEEQSIIKCVRIPEFHWVRCYLEKRFRPELVMLKNIDEVETAVWEGENVSYQFRYHRDTGACWFSMQIHAHYAAPAESLFEFFIPPKERDFLAVLSILDTI